MGRLHLEDNLFGSAHKARQPVFFANKKGRRNKKKYPDSIPGKGNDRASSFSSSGRAAKLTGLAKLFAYQVSEKIILEKGKF
jgi:hypothetical protein